MSENTIKQNKELSILEALFPVVVLIVLLAFNVYVFGDNALSGSNQFILLLGGAVAAIVGFRNGIDYKDMISEVGSNFKSTAGAILILLMVGSLAASWLISGIIPIYGLLWFENSKSDYFSTSYRHYLCNHLHCYGQFLDNFRDSGYRAYWYWASDWSATRYGGRGGAFRGIFWRQNVATF